MRRSFLERLRLPDLLALALAAAVLAVSAYRAATQSITHDEAFAYQQVIRLPWAQLYTRFWDNHHVLQSFLSKGSIELLGLSELALRLPSVLGAVLYVITALALARALLGSAWLRLLAVALLVLDANVLDHLSAARGYGLGLAFFSAGLLCSFEAIRRGVATGGARALLVAAGVAYGLAAASNLAYVLPGVACSLVTVSFAIAGAPAAARPLALWTWAAWLVAPGLAVFGAVAGRALSRMRVGQFYVGTTTLDGFAAAMIQGSFARAGGLRDAPAPRPEPWLFAFVVVAVVAVLTVAAVSLVSRARTPRDDSPPAARSPASAGLRFVGASALGTLAIMILARQLLGVRYPESRMGLVWPPLVYLCAVCAVEAGWLAAGLRRAGAIAVLACCGLALAGDVVSFDVTLYDTWSYDRSSRRYFELIRSRHAAFPERRERLCITWLLEPAMNFYAARHGTSWLERADRSGPRHQCESYVLVGDDVRLVDELGLELLARDDVAQTVLAAPKAR